MEALFADLDFRERYKLLAGGIVPRAIAWVTTWGPDRIVNLAPFSFFTCLSVKPALLGISLAKRSTGELQDTQRNAEENGSYAIHVVGQAHMEEMHSTSAELPSNESELSLTSLKVKQGVHLDVPVLVDAPLTFECTFRRMVDLGGDFGLMVGEVVHASVRPDVIDDNQYFDYEVFQPLGRLIGKYYWAGHTLVADPPASSPLSGQIAAGGQVSTG